MTLELHAHVLTYGISIEGYPAKPPLPPATQWSETGITQWLADARDVLEFSVDYEGWTHFNLIQQDFYNRFEEALV
jgi:hypothetical protein